MFGKVMSISDELMARWYEVLEPSDGTEVMARVRAGTLHPRDAKAMLAAFARIVREKPPGAANIIMA